MAEGAQGGQAKAANANVRYGVYGQPGNYAGKSVSQVRTDLGQMWGIPADAAAYKGKERLQDDYIIQAGDQIEFHRKQGEKG